MLSAAAGHGTHMHYFFESVHCTFGACDLTFLYQPAKKDLAVLSTFATHITSCGSSPLAGPDAKTAAWFPRRCARRYAALEFWCKRMKRSREAYASAWTVFPSLDLLLKLLWVPGYWDSISWYHHRYPVRSSVLARRWQSGRRSIICGVAFIVFAAMMVANGASSQWPLYHALAIAIM